MTDTTSNTAMIDTTSDIQAKAGPRRSQKKQNEMVCACVCACVYVFLYVCMSVCLSFCIYIPVGRSMSV